MLSWAGLIGIVSLGRRAPVHMERAQQRQTEESGESDQDCLCLGPKEISMGGGCANHQLLQSGADASSLYSSRKR